MSRFLLHLATACLTFLVSGQLTRIWRAQTPVLWSEVHAHVALPEPVGSAGEVNLLDIYREYAAAQTRHDQAFFERVESEDFRLFRSDGSFSRTEDIEMMKSDSQDIVFKTEDLKIERKGDAAVVTGRMVSTDADGFVQSWRWIDICVRRNGLWRIISTTQLD